MRRALVSVAKTLKENKALESCRINGLLFLSLDANEHFKSRSRCCERCCQRQIEEIDAQGTSTSSLSIITVTSSPRSMVPKSMSCWTSNRSAPAKRNVQQPCVCSGERAAFMVRASLTPSRWTPVCARPLSKVGPKTGLAVGGRAQARGHGSLSRGPATQPGPRSLSWPLRIKTESGTCSCGKSRISISVKNTASRFAWSAPRNNG